MERTRRCESVAPLLAASIDEPDALDSVAWNHLEHCLRCQAERAQLRRLRATMATMAQESHVSADQAPTWTELLCGVETAIERSQRRAARTRACAAAAAAGVVAGAYVYRRTVRAAVG